VSNEIKSPTTLLEAITAFADEERAHRTICARRWPNGVVCPHCKKDNVTYMEIGRTGKRGQDLVRRLWNCNNCRKQFTAKTGTIFEDSPVSFSKWLPAMWLIANSKNGISSCELARALKVNQRTAWFMLHRIRLIMQNGTLEKLADDIEADETFIGGLSRNMHKHVRAERIKSRGPEGKTIVMGMLERDGDIRLHVIPNTDRSTLHGLIKDHVYKGARVHTDAWVSYRGLSEWYQHQIIDHAYEYVRGTVHTNGLENFWSLLKRTMSGTYVSVEPFHLHRYLDEYSFRFNNRRESDAQRFETLISQVVGKRLTYAKLTGKESVPLGA
jgi:transposase-like protein